MQSFIDSEGRKWSLAFTVDAVKTLRRKLSTPEREVDPIDPSFTILLAADPVLLAETLWTIAVKSDHPTVTAEQFAQGLDGDAIEAAGDALAEALFDFFPKARREINRAMYRKLKAEGETIVQQTVDAIQSLKPIGWAESSESIPAP